MVGFKHQGSLGGPSTAAVARFPAGSRRNRCGATRRGWGVAGLGAKVPGLVAPAPCPVNNGGGDEHDWSTPVEAGCTATAVCGSETTDGAGSGCQAGLGPHAGELERAGSLIQSTTGLE